MNLLQIQIVYEQRNALGARIDEADNSERLLIENRNLIKELPASVYLAELRLQQLDTGDIAFFVSVSQIVDINLTIAEVHISANCVYHTLCGGFGNYCGIKVAGSERQMNRLSLGQTRCNQCTNRREEGAVTTVTFTGDIREESIGSFGCQHSRADAVLKHSTTSYL